MIQGPLRKSQKVGLWLFYMCISSMFGMIPAALARSEVLVNILVVTSLLSSIAALLVPPILDRLKWPGS